jgi:hypothetical protein
MTIARTALCAGAMALMSTVAAAETIYRCERSGGLVFSDRPCADDAAVHATDGSRVSVYAAPPISERASEPRSRASASTPSKSARRGAAEHAKHQAACAKLDQSMSEVRTKLRTGYGVKEGERLKGRQRELAERRRKEKCR